MMILDSTAREIQKHFDQREHIFVFPSEVAAEFRLRQALQQGGKRALRSDRFISWDRLKEQAFSPFQEKLPSNTLYRTIFAGAILKEHTESGPLFEILIGRYEKAEDAAIFQQQIAGILPQLQKTVRLLDSSEAAASAGERETVPTPLREDLRLLYRRYQDFLERHGIFDPAYMLPQEVSHDFVYHIFYPDLIDDFEEYLPLIEAGEQYRLHASDAEPGEDGDGHGFSDGEESTTYRFDNARSELSWLIRRVEELLSWGLHPSEIVITLPEYEAWQPFLEEEALIRGLPLDFRAGRTLSEYSAGRLFSRLADLAGGGMGLEELKLLVLEHGYPWKNRQELQELIRFGIDHFYLRNWGDEGKRQDELARKLKKKDRKDLLRIYRNLRSQVERMVQAESAEELQRHVHTFLHSFFESSAWESESEKVLQYSLLVLRELQEAEERLAPSPILKPFALWISLLSRRIYVSAARKQAVPVYQYRVSAGIFPKYHFILGAGHAETRVRQGDLSFLRDDYRHALLGDELPDHSSAFIREYLQSGQRVYMSCSDQGFAGPQLPPGELLSSGQVQPAPELQGLNDPYADEENFWARKADFPEILTQRQKDAFRVISATGFAPKGRDYTREAVRDQVLFQHMEEVTRGKRGAETGSIWLSPTSYDLYTGCRYSYLLQKGFSLEDEEYGARLLDHRSIGILLHSILADLYGWIQEEDSRWRRERTETYLYKAEEILNRAFEELEKRGDDFIAPVWSWLKAAAREQIAAFIREESRLFDGFRLAESEGEMQAELPDDGIGIYGRIDRLSTKDGVGALVDYKKGAAPKTADIYDEQLIPAVSQLPLYYFIASENNFRIRSASYYSLAEEKYVHVYLHPESPLLRLQPKPKAKISQEAFEELSERLVRSLALVAKGIRAGDFTIAENCASCDFRSVCRIKYNLHLPEEAHGGA